MFPSLSSLSPGSSKSGDKERSGRRSPAADSRLVRLLAEYEAKGVPPIQGLILFELNDIAAMFFRWTEDHSKLVQYHEPSTGELSRMEEVRQAMIRELVITEADYIRSIKFIIDLFIAAAHALQLNGFILDIDTEKIFYNIPDIINANLFFWENTLVPMLQDAMENKIPTTNFAEEQIKKKVPIYTGRVPHTEDTIFRKHIENFNPELMIPGFLDFKSNFSSYETYLKTQSKALDYVKSSCSNADFAEYLTWCHGNKDCNRLQLADFLSKPMQRLTKYPLIMRRIVENTESDIQRAKLAQIESISKDYMQYLNRLIRQREELDAVDDLSASIDPYEIEFKDEDMEKAFRSLSQVNLKAPMVNCLPGHQRMLIYQGDLRFRDTGKEQDVRAFLLTDMLLICKKVAKGPSSYKLLRPKYMVDKLVSFPKQHSRANRDFLSLLYVVLDEVGSACTAFTLSDPGKDGNGHQVTLKMWDQKVREAKKTYDMAVFYAKYPFRDLSEKDSSSELMKAASEEDTADRDAMERMATMLHGTMGTSSEYEYSNSMITDTAAAGAETPGPDCSRTPTLQSTRKKMVRDSTGDSSRISSLQQSLSVSGDEPQPGPSKPTPKASTCAEAAITATHVLPIKPSDIGVTSITVNIVSEPESQTEEVADSQRAEVLQLSPTTQRCSTPQRSPSPHRASSPQRTRTPTLHSPAAPQRSRTPQSPKLAMQQRVMPVRSASAGHTLRVEPQGVSGSEHSLPDIGVEPPASPSQLAQQSNPSLRASEKLYQYHREQLQKRRVAATPPQYLTPDQRGISYPPASPTRASLKRGLAFSHSLKYPPLCKMGHVQSQSQLQPEPSTSTTPTKNKEAPADMQPIKPDKKSFMQTAKSKGKSQPKASNKSFEKCKQINETHEHRVISEQEKEKIDNGAEKNNSKQENDPQKPENNTGIEKKNANEPEDMDKEKKREQKKDTRQDKQEENRREDKESNNDRRQENSGEGNGGEQSNPSGYGNGDDQGEENGDDRKRKNDKKEKSKKQDKKKEKEKKKEKDPEQTDKGKGFGKKSIKLTHDKEENVTIEGEHKILQKDSIKSEDQIVDKEEIELDVQKSHRKLHRTSITEKYMIIPKEKIHEKLKEIERAQNDPRFSEPTVYLEQVNLAGVAAPEPIIESSTTTSSTPIRHRSA